MIPTIIVLALGWCVFASWAAYQCSQSARRMWRIAELLRSTDPVDQEALPPHQAEALRDCPDFEAWRKELK